jgi:hypothetical protein
MLLSPIIFCIRFIINMGLIDTGGNMSTLYGRTPSATYPELLKINHTGGGIDATLREVEDGEGVVTPLKLAVGKLAIHNQLWPSTGAVTGKVLKVSSTANTLVWGSLATNEIDENPLNLFFTTSRARASISATGAIAYDSSTGVISLVNSGVTTGVYGSSSVVPVITVDAQGRITSIATQAVASSAQSGQLSNARTIAATGDATWSVSFNGSANVSSALTLANTGVAAGTYGKVTVDVKGRVTAGAQMVLGDITTALGYTPQNLAQKDSPNGYPGLNASGKISPSQLPAIAISDTFVISNQASMLALTAEIGDIAIRTDLSRSYILKTDGASTLANWQELLTPSDTVQSVNGMAGTVTLSTSQIAEGSNLYYTAARAASASPVQTVAGRTGAIVLAVADVSGAVNKAGDTMTGMLTLKGNPTSALHAATKSYVDASLGGFNTFDGGEY